MRILFWTIGASCAGKSFFGKIIANKLGVKLVHLDCVNDRINIDKLDKKAGYENLLNNLGDVAVIDGIIPFNFKEDMAIVQDLIKDFKIIYVLCKPTYEDYLIRVKNRKIEIPESKPRALSKLNYENYYGKLKERVVRYLLVENEKDLDIVSDEQIRNLNYQHGGFTDVKYKQLQIDPRGQSVLDLGCSSCQYEPLLMDAGAISYTGLDVNFSYLINKNAYLFNLNELEKWQDPHDIVICSSVFHYIHDKEKFIKECARLTKKLFVFETPLSKEPGDKLVLGSRGLYFTTKEMTERLILKYFSSFNIIGKSIVEDGSYRLIYHCIK